MSINDVLALLVVLPLMSFLTTSAIMGAYYLFFDYIPNAMKNAQEKRGDE